MSATQHRLDIQGLRALAVLSVMVFHFNSAWLPGGFVGVDVFLVISGFLIVSILLHKKNQPSYRLTPTLQYFYGSRLKRIAPAYFAMLVFVSFIAALLFLPEDLSIYRQGLLQAAWFNSNTYFANFGDYFAPANYEQPLLHTWSLAVEVQFYLLVPLLVLLVPHKALKWALGLLLIAFTVLAEYRLRILGIEQATYYSLFARLPEFFAGGLAALLVQKKQVRSGGAWFSTLGLILVLAATAIQPQLGPFPGLPALLPVVGVALILLYPAQGLAQQVLCNRPMVWVGGLSYSLYLWHWPVLALLRYYTGDQVLSLLLGMLFVVITLLLAALSFYGLETPLRAHQPRIKQAVTYGLFSLAAFGAFLGIGKLNSIVSPPLPIEYRRYADPAIICHGQIVGECLKGDLNSEKEVLVLGDSHAAMLNLFFDTLGKDLGFKARIITASSCVTIPNFDYLRLPEWARKPCLAQIEYAKRYLPGATTVFVAASWSWQLESVEFQNTLGDFLAKQSSANKKIYLMEQVPLLNRHLLRAMRFRTFHSYTGAAMNPAYKEANKKIEQYKQQFPTVTTLNFESTGVFEHAPFYGNELLYMDGHHLNEVGAKRYGAAARSAFSKIMD